MNSLFEKVISGGITAVVGKVADIVDRFVQTSDEKAKIMLELKALEVSETKSIVEAASKVLEVEAVSSDPWVRRARPTFLYIMYTVICWNFILLPLFQFATGSPIALIELPEDLYWLFGAGFLGYVGARSWDKKKSGLL